MIFLISTIEPRRLNLLAQMIAHYRSLGVDRFLFTLHLDPGNDLETNSTGRKVFESILSRFGIAESFYCDVPFDSDDFYHHKDNLQWKLVSAEDWIVWADSDEFQKYPAPISEIVRINERKNVNYLRGILIDRVGPDGSLPKFDPSSSIWEQYPVCCAVTHSIAKGYNIKVALAQGWMQVTYGHHMPAAIEPARAAPMRIAVADHPELRTTPGVVQVHHFKWEAGVIDRLRERVTPEMQSTHAHWVESQRLLDYFESNGNCFGARDLQKLELPNDKFLIFNNAQGNG